MYRGFVRKPLNNRDEQEQTPKMVKGKIDYIIFVCVLLLVVFGVIMVFSASYYYAETKLGNIYYFFRTQGTYAVIGIIVMIIMSRIPIATFKNLAFITYIISIGFLILVLIPGIGVEKNGARRWLDFGFINFQPSEVAKIGLILFLSQYISDHKGILNDWTGFFKCCFIIGIPAFLIFIENASTAIVLATIGFSIIFVASPKLKYFVLPVVGFFGLILIMLFGGGYRSTRIKIWRDPFLDPTDKGFQTIQSLYAIASGGFFGLGLGQSRQKLGFIPEGHNDIIFAIICEELGLCGAILVVILFIILVWRGLIVAMNSPKPFMCYVSTGITCMVAVQVILNIAVVTNTIPNTGIPLPFISYGGTSLMIMLGSIGILLAISRRYLDYYES